MTMKLEITDSQSNHSDYSCDSQSSQESSNNGSVATVPTTRPTSLLFASLDGLNSGVPTRTTATITPTQLRGFEQTYIDIAPDHVRFVPPSITHANSYGMLNSMSYCESGPPSVLHVSPGPMSASGDSSSSPGLPAPKRRNMGGRRPTKAPHDISPEEEERRRIRRERNKVAAARCRKRRMDHTNTLQAETDELEAKKQGLQDEIRKLHVEKENLAAALANHTCCRLGKRSVSPPEVKPFQQETYSYIEDVRVKEEVPEQSVGVIPGVDPMLGLEEDILLPSPTLTTNNKIIMFSATNPAVVTTTPCNTLETPPASTARINRPTFLQVPMRPNPAQIHNNKVLGNNKIAGVEITTPSNGLPFNFDSIMDGGTGLTPVHPLPYPCAQQQRNNPDITPPDSHNNSLVRL